VCTPHLMCASLGPPESKSPNGIAIGSVVFAGLATETIQRCVEGDRSHRRESKGLLTVVQYIEPTTTLIRARAYLGAIVDCKLSTAFTELTTASVFVRAKWRWTWR